MSTDKPKHVYHLVDPSPWPLVASFGAFSGRTNENVFDLGNIDAGQNGEGVLLGYATDSISVKVAAFNGIGEAEETSAGSNSDDLDYEFAISFTGLENLVLTAGVRSHSASSDDISNNFDADTDTTNITAAYTLDKLLLAAEYTNVDIDVANVDDLSAYLILADYDINDKMGIAVRYSEWETGTNAEADKIAIAPNYAITDSLGAILEYSSTETTGGAEADTLALELTFTF